MNIKQHKNEFIHIKRNTCKRIIFGIIGVLCLINVIFCVIVAKETGQEGLIMNAPLSVSINSIVGTVVLIAIGSVFIVYAFFGGVDGFFEWLFEDDDKK